MYNIPKTAFEEAQEENEVEDEEDEKEIEMELEDDRLEYVAADSDDESDLVIFCELLSRKCYSLMDNSFFRTVKVEIQKKLIWTAVLKQMTLILR